MPTPFHPFDPVGPRRALLVAAALCAALGGAALAGAEEDLWALLRAGLCGGLLVGFVLLHRRLAPRPGFGVTLAPDGLTVARPLSGKPFHLPWEEISQLTRPGRRRALVLGLREGGRVVLTRQLFPSAGSFEALASALEDRLPAPAHDA